MLFTLALFHEKFELDILPQLFSTPQLGQPPSFLGISSSPPALPISEKYPQLKLVGVRTMTGQKHLKFGQCLDMG